MGEPGCVTCPVTNAAPIQRQAVGAYADSVGVGVASLDLILEDHVIVEAPVRIGFGSEQGMPYRSTDIQFELEVTGFGRRFAEDHFYFDELSDSVGLPVSWPGRDVNA